MGVTINRKLGQLNRTEPTEDAVICLVVSGVAVAGGIQLGDPRQIFGTDGLATLGITAANNPLAYKDIIDFYDKAGEGAELNVMLYVDTTTLADVCDKNLALGKKLLDFTNGRGVVLVVNKKLPVGYVSAPLNGLETDVWNAVTKLNELAVHFQTLNIPFVGVLPGIGFTVATLGNLPNRSTLANDNVGMNFFCTTADKLVAQGAIAGWIAKHQVHQSIARVLSGKISDVAYMPDQTSANDVSITTARTVLDAKGIIFPVKRGQKSGFFLNDDPTLTATDSDYSSISWNRTINKAHRIAEDVLTEKVNDTVDTDPATGKIESSLASDWESDVENAIRGNMINVGNNKRPEISAVQCIIDPNSNIINDQVDADITIVRKGQAKNINVKIGYGVTV